MDPNSMYYGLGVGPDIGTSGSKCILFGYMDPQDYTLGINPAAPKPSPQEQLPRSGALLRLPEQGFYFRWRCLIPKPSTL